MNDIEFRKKTTELLFELAHFCEENDIWYSLANQTLLGAKRHGGFIPWQIHAQIYMTQDSYEKLRRRVDVYRENIDSRNKNLFEYKFANIEKVGRLIDNFQDRWFTINTPIYQRNLSKIRSVEPHVQILIIVPTSDEKFKKYKRMYKVFLDFFKRKSYINYIQELEEKKSTDKWAIIKNKRINTNKKDLIPIFKLDRETIKFNGKDIKVIENYEAILQKMYGNDYMEVYDVPKKYQVHPNGLV